MSYHQRRLAARAGDGRFGPFRFPIGTLPGEWRPTAGVNDPFAWLKDVRPFVLRDPDLFRGRAPQDPSRWPIIELWLYALGAFGVADFAVFLPALL
jgi:hypothetical protein